MDRNGGNVTDGIHVPDLAEQLFLGIYMIGMLRKEGQQIEFLGGKGLFHTVHIHSSRSFIDAQSPDFHNVVLGLCIGANQSFVSGKMRFYPCYEFAGAERLCHVIVRTQTQTSDFINIILFSGNHEDGDILLFPNLLAHLKAIHTGKHQVQYNQVKILFQSSL